MTNTRKQFEADPEMEKLNAQREYSNTNCTLYDGAWLGWQASQQSLLSALSEPGMVEEVARALFKNGAMITWEDFKSAHQSENDKEYVQVYYDDAQSTLQAISKKLGE